MKKLLVILCLASIACGIQDVTSRQPVSGRELRKPAVSVQAEADWLGGTITETTKGE
jgi:hypothetical protein